MRILDIASDLYNGCYWYRNGIPFRELKKRGHSVKLNLGAGGGVKADLYDIFHMTRGYDGNYSEVAFILKLKGLPLVYDIDDAMDLVNITNVWYEAVHKVLPSYYYLLNTADLVTTTTQRLADHLQTFAPKAKIMVLPNCMDPEEWGQREGSRHEELRIGVAGSITHIEDIIVVMEAVKMLRYKWRNDSTKPKITFVIFGFGRYGDTPEDLLAKNRANLANNPRHPFLTALKDFENLYRALKDCIEWAPSVPIEMYPYFLRKLNLDIGCAPLKEQEFNLYKSSIKMYEYSMVGTFGVCSDFGSFKDEDYPNRVPHDPVKWMENFERYVSDGSWRYGIEQVQKDFISKNRLASKWVDAREQAYKALLKK